MDTKVGEETSSSELGGCLAFLVFVLTCAGLPWLLLWLVGPIAGSISGVICVVAYIKLGPPAQPGLLPGILALFVPMSGIAAVCISLAHLAKSNMPQ